MVADSFGGVSADVVSCEVGGGEVESIHLVAGSFFLGVVAEDGVFGGFAGEVGSLPFVSEGAVFVVGYAGG